MFIRDYEEKDLSEILEVFYNSVRNIRSYNYTREEIEHWAPDEPDIEDWRRSLGNSITNVAESSGKIIGFAQLTKEGYIERLYIHNSFQGKGVGSQLIADIEMEAQNRGIKEIIVYAAEIAKGFYEKMGYTCLKKMRRDYNGLIYNNYVLRKKI
ncbi:GNAT family N-acetyltransferase [Clostridium cellulovorans]|uniref:GCN5-related N-acetyltransferase n=1 Tax=Clostridium cellulovorans (strain ATCC 35296 / DSM 3052 / OCM 3 / 743B) TaxID=573061 RepID=D9SWU7_CLOC7|nr:GNAT family N-acetyltransferase [Clostridium cellulovorans]ADL51308.1 GCN5-related N-acetyltransferase [Clostridium cellulovorans 743B]